MKSGVLDPGLYVNVFEVSIPDAYVSVVTSQASTQPSLRDLRHKIQSSGWKVRVYRHDDQVFGYGQDVGQLSAEGFQPQEIRLWDYPKWCARLVVEGLQDHLESQQYRARRGKGRIILYEPDPYGKAARGVISVFRGYDLRAVYQWRDNRPLFGLIVDVCWAIEDANGKRLSTPEIAQYNAMAEIAQIQDEYLPNNRINPEVSRLRLQRHILPFVMENAKFILPCDSAIEATLEKVPVRVIIGV